MPVVMDGDRMGRSLARIAHEVLERNRGLDDLALVGIRARGVPLAGRLASALHELSGVHVPTGALDITLYRDDLMRHQVGPQPVIRRTEIPFSIDDRRILLVDDVLYTGRTIRAALDALIEQPDMHRQLVHKRLRSCSGVGVVMQVGGDQSHQLGVADDHALFATLVHCVGHLCQQLTLGFQAHAQLGHATVLHALLGWAVGLATPAAQQHLDALLVQCGAVLW